MPNPAVIVEQRDSLAQLAALGFGALLSALEYPDVYTRRGRVVFAEVGRRMKLPPAKARDELKRARAALDALEN